MTTTVVNSNALSVQYGTYLDMTMDCKPWLQIPASDTSKDMQLQLCTDAACQWVQAEFFNSPIGETTYLRRFDGWSGLNGAYIMLPITPVLEIVKVTEYRGTFGPVDLSESTPTNQIDGWQCSYQTGRMTRIFPGLVQRPWFPGSRNIEVTWTAGVMPVPANIKMGTLNLVAEWFRSALQVGAMRGHNATGNAQHTDPVWGEIPDWIIDQLGGSQVRVNMG